MVCSGLLFTATLTATAVVAQEMRYVQPSVDIPVRRAGGHEYKIVKIVKDGDRVTLLEESGDWAKIRVANGKEGWMVKRFLSVSPPPLKQIKILRTENEQLKAHTTVLEQELAEIKKVQISTGGELNACISRRDTVLADYQTLLADTTDVVALKNKMIATTKEIEDVQAVLVNVQQENNELKRNTAVTWFLIGGSVFLLAWLIGLLTGRSSKRKRSSLL